MLVVLSYDGTPDEPTRSSHSDLTTSCLFLRFVLYIYLRLYLQLYLQHLGVTFFWSEGQRPVIFLLRTSTSTTTTSSHLIGTGDRNDWRNAG
jgi:hypothetical protein